MAGLGDFMLSCISVVELGFREQRRSSGGRQAGFDFIVCLGLVGEGP